MGPSRGRRHLVQARAEQVFNFLDQILPAFEIAGGSHTDGNLVAARLLELDEVIKRDDPVHLCQRDVEVDGHQERRVALDGSRLTDPTALSTVAIQWNPMSGPDCVELHRHPFDEVRTRRQGEGNRPMTSNQSATKTIPFMKGMNVGFAAMRGWYGSDEGLAQIERMKALHIEWVAAHVTFVQETYASTRVFMDYEFTPEDGEVRRWIDAAHAAGIKVMLKPILEPLDGIWRGHIMPPGDAQSVYARLQPRVENHSRWTKSFKAALCHYADLAAGAGAECVSLGQEYLGLEACNDIWEEVIPAVRARYDGLLTYEFTPPNVLTRKVHPHIGAWWKHLDFLGYSFYGANEDPDAPLEDLLAGLAPRRDEAAALAEEFGVPLAILETGRRSTRGMTGQASDFASVGRYDGDIQARYYEAVLQTFWDEPWFRGVYWWKWDELQAEYRPQYYADPAGDQGFTIEGKPAADIVKRWYAGERSRPEMR
jgi:hypothetical protein